MTAIEFINAVEDEYQKRKTSGGLSMRCLLELCNNDLSLFVVLGADDTLRSTLSTEARRDVDMTLGVTCLLLCRIERGLPGD